jgi:hypothetical protein
MAKLAEKNEESMVEVLWQIMQSMAKAVHFSTELVLRKHPKVNFHMELTME